MLHICCMMFSHTTIGEHAWSVDIWMVIVCRTTFIVYVYSSIVLSLCLLSYVSCRTCTLYVMVKWSYKSLIRLYLLLGLSTLSAAGWETNLCSVWETNQPLGLSHMWFCWMWKVKQYVILSVLSFFIYWASNIYDFDGFQFLMVSLDIDLLDWLYSLLNLGTRKGMLLGIGMIRNIAILLN